MADSNGCESVGGPATMGMSQKSELSDTDHTDAHLAKKIEALQANSDLKEDERNLVSLVLLTRLKNDEVNSLFSSQLFNFSIRLAKENHTPFLRVVCVLIPEVDCSTYDWEAMLQALLLAATSRQSFDRVDSTLLLALAHCLAMNLPLNLPADALDRLWKQFQQNQTTTISKEEANAKTASMQQLMERMLQPEAEQTDDTTAYLQAFLLLWQIVATKSETKKSPQWFESMIVYVVSEKSNVSTRSEWHDVLLQCTSSLAMHTHKFSIHNPKAAQALVNLIMIHIGSPQSATYAQAWETCSILIGRHGWAWASEEGSSLISQSSHFCTWTRLAAGEYRIQLELACMEEDPKASRESTLDACGCIVLSALQAVADEATVVDEGQAMSYERDALFHLRHSFLDVLQSTISYFLIATSSPMMVMCSKVLGSLLGEFSIWDELRTGTTPEEALQAVGKSLADGVVETLHCLVNLFVSAEEDESRVNQLRHASIWGDKVVDYFQSIWSTSLTNQTSDSVQWASTAIESWISLASPSAKQRKKLSKVVVGWIKGALADPITTDMTASVMSAVGCYAMLTIDRAPSEHDSEIIERALSSCV